MAEKDNLSDAVADAVGDKKIEETETETESETETETESESEHEEAEDETLEVEGTKEEIQNALVFFRTLNNPAERTRLIESLAREGGYDLTKKTEAKKLERDAKSILREKLGANYDILSGDLFAEAMEELVADKVAKLTSPVIERVNQNEKSSNDQKAATAMNNFFTRNEIKDPKDREAVASKMMVKIKQMPATPDTNVDTYLDDIYSLVSKDKSASDVKRTVTRIRQNAKDSSRLSGEGTGNDDRIKSGSETPDLDESVRAAFAGKKYK